MSKSPLERAMENREKKNRKPLVQHSYVIGHRLLLQELNL